MKSLFGFLRHFIESALRKGKRDWEIIFYCIGTAALFWLLNAMGKVYEYRIAMPVRYQFDENRYVSVAELPLTLPLRVEGRGWDLARAIWAWDPEPISIAIKRPLETHYLLPGNWLANARELYPTVKVEAIETDSILCLFDKRSSKTFPLFADLKGLELQPGFRISSPIRITPSTVTLTGSESLLRTIPPELPVQIEGQNIRESVDQNVRLDFGPRFQESPLLRYGIQMVNVQFTIRPSLEEEMEVPIRLPRPEGAGTWILREQKVRISFLVSEKDKKDLSPDEFGIIADPSTFNSQDSTMEIRLVRKPVFVSDVQLGTKKIRVYGRP